MENIKWFILWVLTALLIFIIYNNNKAYWDYEYEVDEQLSLQEYTWDQVIIPEVYEYQYQKDKLTQFEAIDGEFAEGLIELCNKYAQDLNLCLNHIVWVSSAESSVFKRCSSWNNCFGLMSKKGLKRYETKLQWVEDWLQTYIRLWRNKRLTPQAWLDGKYCASECKYWTTNYLSATNKLSL